MRALLVLLPFLLAACSTPTPTTPEKVVLLAPDGERPLREIAARAPLTVLVFLAADCPCLHAHLARLRDLSAIYAPKGVQFLAVDSEVGATPARAAAAKSELELPFPVVVDARARLANALGAEYATFTVVLDREARVRYRGGIDSDKRKLHDGATPYVKDALDDLLAGKAPRRPEGKALGCVLRKW